MPPSAGTSDQSDSVVRVASSFEHNCASVIDRLAVFDGLMEEAADDAAIMPHLARFRQQGCLMTQHRPVFPSVTRWVAPRGPHRRHACAMPGAFTGHGAKYLSPVCHWHAAPLALDTTLLCGHHRKYAPCHRMPSNVDLSCVVFGDDHTFKTWRDLLAGSTRLRWPRVVGLDNMACMQIFRCSVAF